MRDFVFTRVNLANRDTGEDISFLVEVKELLSLSQQ